MKKLYLLFICIWMFQISYAQPQQTIPDWRNLKNAVGIIPDEGYCDQPYAVVNNKGEWVVVMTTGMGHEGQRGQHIVSTISRDKGKTWTPHVDIEPADGPEASWVCPLIVPSGRIYVFYTYNYLDWSSIKDINGKLINRVDTWGKVMLKYSDDGGYSWSPDRYEVPVRNFEIDENNIYDGAYQFFWSVALPIIHDGAVYYPLSKVGDFGPGFMTSGSGAIVKSSNLLAEKDASKIKWETLPDGNKGLLPPVGKVCDEHNIVSMNDGSLFCVARTNQGHNVQYYSRDNGHTWSSPAWARYNPEGQLMKQPRALNKIKKFKNGKYALFFHNNGARDYGNHPIGNRNPVWLAGGIEKDGFIHWSQPEILLYDDDYNKGISYPDWIEDDGEYYLTETQKTIARLHKIPVEYMDMLWSQSENDQLTEGAILTLSGKECEADSPFKMPKLGKVTRGNSFTLEFVIASDALKKEQVILDTRRTSTAGTGNAAEYKGNGIVLKTASNGALEIILEDGRTPMIWNTGDDSITPESTHHVAFVVDANSKTLTCVIDGVLCDGGDRAFGYARFNTYMYDVNGKEDVTFSADFRGMVKLFRIYNRSLYHSEAIGNYRATIK